MTARPGLLHLSGLSWLHPREAHRSTAPDLRSAALHREPGQAPVDVVRVVSGVPAENRTAASYLLPAPIAFRARPPSGRRIQPLIERRT